MSVTTVRLQAEVEQRLEAIASRLHRSKSWVINQALSEYIEKQQLEQERWKQTLEAMESAAQGKVVDASEVKLHIIIFSIVANPQSKACKLPVPRSDCLVLGPPPS